MRLTQANPRWVTLANWSPSAPPFYVGVSFECPCPKCSEPPCPHCSHKPHLQRLTMQFWPPIDPSNAAANFMIPVQPGDLACDRVSGDTFETLTLAPSMSFMGHDWVQLVEGELIHCHYRIEKTSAAT